MDAVFGNADVAAGRLDVLAHSRWTADEDMIDGRGGDQRAQQHAHFFTVEPAVQDRDVLLLARDHMEKREPLHKTVLQLFQRFEEHHARGRAVAVEQKNPAVRLPRQHALDDRQDRRDARACGKADIDPRLVGRSRDAEAAGRRHHIEFVAGLQFVRGPVRERAAVDLLHGDAQFAIVGAGADRIGTAYFLAVHGGAQGQVLPGVEAVVVRQVLWNRECQRHGVRRLAAQVVDGKAMETRGVGHIQ